MENEELENKIVIYETEDGKTQLDVKLENETVWLTQGQMAELFQKDQSVIARHISNAIREGEIDEKSNMQILHNTQYKYRPTKIYNLDVIISVGYRVHSLRGVAFRKWATSVLRSYLVKGYAINQRIREENYRQMVQLVRSMARTVKLQDLSKEVQNALLDVVVDYTLLIAESRPEEKDTMVKVVVNLIGHTNE
jgi:hypothetical protein